jgi:hypothetical protein
MIIHIATAPYILMTKVEIIDFFAETYSNIGLYNNFDANNDYFD